MSNFNNIKELINTLAWSKELLAEMFEKRKSFVYKYELALEILEEERIETLIGKGIIRLNGPYLELDDQFQLFFEQILEVNEEINTSYINENIELVKQQIDFYLQENNEHRRYTYLKQVKSILRKIGRITLRNIIDLNRNIENAFKAEPNYKIKIARLEAFDEKHHVIFKLIEQTDRLVSEEERTFFMSATDEALKQLVNQLRQQLTEARHNLIETQKQVIEYLNQVKYQSSIIEKIQQLKYLKGQFELRSKTNLLEILHNSNAVLFGAKPSYPVKLSLDFLQTDEGHLSKLKVATRLKHATSKALPVAELIAADYLQTETEEEVFINLEELKNGFIASGNHLFNFIITYRYPRPVSFEEKVTIFCQMVGIYENEFTISGNFQLDHSVEYAMVHPK